MQCVALKPEGPPIWEPGNNRRVSVPRPGGLPGSSGEEIDLVLGLLEGGEGEPHPEAQLVETSGGSTMVKLTTTYTAAFGEYLKVWTLLPGNSFSILMHWIYLLILLVVSL